MMEIILSTLALFALFVPTESQERSRDVQLDPRPFWLIDQMRPSTLKDQLAMCAEDTKHYAVSDFSIGHRGACLQFPEHTLESYAAALEMGAGIVECDVTFTKDRQLICRHSQCDLHTTTNVVTIPDLNAKCTTPWSAGVSPNCCASDFTLDEIKTLCAKMDSSGPSEAATAEEYAYGGTADWRTDLYQLESCPEVPTHKESIAFIKAGNGYFTPELKSPSVEMPYEGNYTQEMYAQQMIDEYVEAGVPPEQVWPQSFSPDDVFYWIDNTEFGAQAVALDDQYDLNTTDVEAFLDLLVSRNVKIVAPPMQRLVDPAPDSEYLMTASHYANAAKNRSLGVIAWTLERSGPGLTGFYWETLEDQVELNEGDRYNLLHVLLNEVEVLGVFSDWPATTTFFANCMGATLRSSPVMAAANDDRVGGIGSVQVGPRPYWLVEQMRPSALKNELVACADRSNEFLVSDFSIGHRGACLQFPEHTLESYAAALEMGAGIVECDVTFTKDRQLICRHSQCDLHTTTNVVTIPDLNAKCTTPWSAGVSPNCCASDFTLDEIKTLCAKMDSSGPSEAATAEEYAYGGTADWRTDLYQLESCPEVPTHKESIAFIKAGNGYFTPELKSPSVEMPYEGNYTQEMYAQQMIDEYVEAGVPPEQVWPQSFSPDDVFYWIDNTEFGAQAVALDDQYDLNTTDVEAFLDLLVSRNVKIVAPPMQRLVDPAPDSEYLMTASHYANAAKNRSLGVIAWTLERSGPGLTGFYWETLEDQVELNEGDRYDLLHVLLNEVEVLGVFSDWPATTTFFANCMGATLRTAEEIDVAVEGSNTSASAQVGSIVATITISALVHLLIFT